MTLTREHPDLFGALPDNVRRRLASERSSEGLHWPEIQTRVIGRAADALDAASATVRRMGWEVLNLGEIEGESSAVAEAHASTVLNLRRERPPGAGPLVILSGGETTTSIEDSGGHGGRNTEYLLALVLALGGAAGVHGLAADTDGLDGRGGHAGAVFGPETLARAAAHGLDAREFLHRHDSARFFAELDDLIVTGPTRTNVNDFRAVLIEAPSGV